jgi:hypothetical protein
MQLEDIHYGLAEFRSKDFSVRVWSHVMECSKQPYLNNLCVYFVVISRTPCSQLLSSARKIIEILDMIKKLEPKFWSLSTRIIRRSEDKQNVSHKKNIQEEQNEYFLVHISRRI